MIVIEMNRKYRTRDGRAVRVLCVDAGTAYPVVGVLADQPEQLHRWMADGVFSRLVASEHRLNLVEASEWDDFKIDEPVMVRDRDSDPWSRGYFAGVYSSTGNPMTWRHATASWTACGKTQCWNQCRRPTPEELGGGK